MLDLSFFIPINVITFQFSGLVLKVQHAGVLPVTEAMGVLGLWTLMEPAVPVESLSHKVLAVDISIWLNQAVRGFRDRQGNAVPHGHLLGLYHRICKLLFYRWEWFSDCIIIIMIVIFRIKPVFVFDGAPPQLKKDTLARRRMRRSKDSKGAKVASQKILGKYLQRRAVAQRLHWQTQAMESVARVGTEGLHQLYQRRWEEGERLI